MRSEYQAILTTLVYRRKIFVPCFSSFAARRFSCFRSSARTSSRATDTGQFRLHVRGKTGTRIEEVARLFDQVDQSIRRQIPKAELCLSSRQHRTAV